MRLDVRLEPLDLTIPTQTGIRGNSDSGLPANHCAFQIGYFHFIRIPFACCEHIG